MDKLGILDDGNHTVISYDNTRLALPKKIHRQLLNMLHFPHLGQINTIRAVRCWYWLNIIDHDIKKDVEMFDICSNIKHNYEEEKWSCRQSLIGYTIKGTTSYGLWDI